jgi:hypothetical protein
MADPLTGLWAAGAVIGSQLAGGGHLIDVSMAGVSRHLSRPDPAIPTHVHHFVRESHGWRVGHAGGVPTTIQRPRPGQFS